MSIDKAFDVDVFEHPRFCNEFSHLWKQRFFGLYKSLLDPQCAQMEISVSFNALLHGYTSLIDSLCQLNKRLK